MIFFQMEIHLTVTSVLTVRGYIDSISHRHMSEIVCRDPACGMELSPENRVTDTNDLRRSRPSTV